MALLKSASVSVASMSGADVKWIGP
ncbi:hypothetical protein SHJG_p1018 (plasmid) [Streptomyces hygroscopicus subsp. jinggangensis 5008]|nr:hypothetical protein SHJG_p1018 [Streptomyces hygroscopicus subsp. jinggangensis 5008]AGF68303.1 hypothetical protein SHJGH_p1018 [Streptomyces hygroscopicus subsp. jinggangensis TL01]